MHPVVNASRALIPGGLWTTKLSGHFERAGDAAAICFIEGKADIKELNGSMRLFLQDVKCIQRPRYLSQKEKDEIIAKYSDEMREKRIMEETEDSDDEDAKERKKKAEEKEIERRFAAEEKRIIPPPKLAVFLSKKKPKARMTDIHKTGARLFFQNGQYVPISQDPASFESSLKDVPDAISYLGLVVLKLPHDEPRSEEPMIYGFVKLNSVRSLKVKSGSALGLSEIADNMYKVMQAQGGQSKNSRQTKVLDEALKPLHMYRDLANKAWHAFQKSSTDEVDKETFVNMLDYCDIFLVNAQAQRIFNAVDLKKSGTLGVSEFENFLMAYDVLEQASSDLLVLDTYDSLKVVNTSETHGKFGENEGMDYSGFCEAIQVLGVRTTDTMLTLDAFCHGAGVPNSKVADTYLTLDQFKKAWLDLADIEEEMRNRDLKSERGLMAGSRNKERLLRILQEQESNYLEKLRGVNDMVETFKREKREKRDAVKRERNAAREKMRHDSAKFVALRAQEKRLKQKDDAEERVRKRLEEKQLKEDLLRKKEEAKLARKRELAEAALKAENLRYDQIRELGFDRMDYSMQNLRTVPSDIYGTEETNKLLSYAVIFDISKNHIETLPHEGFFFRFSDARKILLSQNRIREIPKELCMLERLQILELQSNKLTSLPEDVSRLKELEVLDASNNLLQELPAGIGSCSRLKNLTLHSNHLRMLPSELGVCFCLEYLDISRNSIHELPEHLENLSALVHFDCSRNRISRLFYNIGGCLKLQNIDASSNLIVSLPESISILKCLEFMNIENNELQAHENRFRGMKALKKLQLGHNKFEFVPKDLGLIGESLNLLDLSNNKVSLLWPEIGMLTALEELRLAYNDLETLPYEIGACKRLQVMILRNNRITGLLTGTIGLVETLRVVDVSNNQIDSLPKSIVALSQMEVFIASGNFIRVLPEEFKYLTRLQTLDLTSNKLSVFPTCVFSMPVLKTLKLGNNFIPLLPKEIDSLASCLKTFSLRGNELRALPMGFVLILECVENVDIGNNPWYDLPPRWGKKFKGKETVNATLGIDVADCVDFLHNMNTFYYAAEEIWNAASGMGRFHFSHKFTMVDFREQVKDRIRGHWHDGLIEYVDHIYIKARETGIFPRWYTLNEEQLREEEVARQERQERRERVLVAAKTHAEKKAQERISTYDRDLMERTRFAASRLEEERVVATGVQKAAIIGSLHFSMEKAREDMANRKASVENNRELKAREEYRRLLGRMNAKDKSKSPAKASTAAAISSEI